MISIIVATAQNSAIGKENRLLWHISGDLKYFRKVTTGHPVIMGYNTWLSVGERPLPGRRNMVISRRHSAPEECGAEFFPSLEDALRALRNPVRDSGPDQVRDGRTDQVKDGRTPCGGDGAGDGSAEVFIIGGGQLYRTALPMADRLYVTEVETVIEDADVFFPEVDPAVWKEESRSERMHDEKSGLYYSFLIFTRQ